MVKAICFDLDGTLAQYTGDFQALGALLRSELMLQQCDMNRFQEILGSELRRDGALTLEDALGGVHERLEQRPPADLGQVAEAVVASYAEDVRPLPGAEELLKRLDGAGVKLALLTNGPYDMQSAALNALGFARYFRVVLVSGDRDVAARKPAPRIFSLALAGLETLPEAALMVGDDLEADVLGALDFGLGAVLMCRNGAAPPPELPEGVQSVGTLAELDDLLSARYGL